MSDLFAALGEDAETDKIKAQTTKQNFEHIEKHMVLLQEERQKHMEQNKLLQQAVDATLERLLVWVQATFDSLRDFGPEAVQQDAKALEAVRDMLAWLAQRTCKAWIDPPATLEKALSSHEERLRAALAAPGRSEQTPKVEELRKELQQQRQRAEELEALLKEAEQREQKLLARRVLVESATPVPQEEVVEAAPAAMPSPKPQLPAPDEVQDPAVSDAPEQVEERREETCDAGAAAAAEAEQEAQRMRLFRCPFAEAIDLTLSRCGPEDEDKRLGRRQLRSFIGEVYTAKRLEDRRRDKAAQPRRALHCIMQEMLRRLHGVKSLVHRRSWQLLEAIAEHASSDTTVGLFADFLDGSRDLDELSFYLYCSALIASTPEETQVPSRLPLGIVSEPRCIRLLELLFDDLPKARTVVKEEIEKQVPRMNLAGDPWEEFSLFEEVRCIEADGLCRALLEGWRVCCLLLTKNLPHFSWRDTVLAFLQADVHGRGWLDPHEVQKAESRPRAPRPSTLPLTDQTTLGAFVFRTVQSLGGLNNPVDLKEEATELASCEPKREPEACLQLCLAAFHSLEPSLAVYLKWLLHSEEPRDRTVYQSVKARIFGVRRSASAGKVWPLMHNLRCLLVLLLSHQFDMQLVREEAQPEHIGWEMTALLQVLRESWRRGASGQGVESGPEFGPELEEVGEANMREQCDSDQERPVSGRERTAPKEGLTAQGQYPKKVLRASAKELKYPEGVQAGDLVSGSEGEYFRYKHVFVKPPDDEDRMEALKMAKDITCSACEVLLDSLLKQAESMTEDHILDQFDGELLEPPALSDNAQENRVNQNRRGCNKHFKDELLLRGWAARKCASTEGAEWCLERGAPPSERDVDTYNVRNEAVFYACESTVGRLGAEIAAKVAELKEDGLSLAEVVRIACQEAGRCDASKVKRRKGKAKSKEL
ncbi:unnamed protein product [Effrenium voratum]|nr:unnamed protein product [Effrenium voratum]